MISGKGNKIGIEKKIIGMDTDNLETNTLFLINSIMYYP